MRISALLLGLVFVILGAAPALAEDGPHRDPLALRVGAQLKITRILELTGAVSRGLSDGAEDWGGYGALTVRF